MTNITPFLANLTAFENEVFDMTGRTFLHYGKVCTIVSGHTATGADILAAYRAAKAEAEKYAKAAEDLAATIDAFYDELTGDDEEQS